MFQAGYLPNIDENLFLISLTTYRTKPSIGQCALDSEFKSFFFFPAWFNVHKETLASLVRDYFISFPTCAEYCWLLSRHNGIISSFYRMPEFASTVL